MAAEDIKDINAMIEDEKSLRDFKTPKLSGVSTNSAKFRDKKPASPDKIFKEPSGIKSPGLDSNDGSSKATSKKVKFEDKVEVEVDKGELEEKQPINLNLASQFSAIAEQDED